MSLVLWFHRGFPMPEGTELHLHDSRVLTSVGDSFRARGVFGESQQNACYMDTKKEGKMAG